VATQHFTSEPLGKGETQHFNLIIPSVSTVFIFTIYAADGPSNGLAAHSNAQSIKRHDLSVVATALRQLPHASLDRYPLSRSFSY
jgi:hypothetical protein